MAYFRQIDQAPPVTSTIPRPPFGSLASEEAAHYKQYKANNMASSAQYGVSDGNFEGADDRDLRQALEHERRSPSWDLKGQEDPLDPIDGNTDDLPGGVDANGELLSYDDNTLPGTYDENNEPGACDENDAAATYGQSQNPVAGVERELGLAGEFEEDDGSHSRPVEMERNTSPAEGPEFGVDAMVPMGADTVVDDGDDSLLRGNDDDAFAAGAHDGEGVNQISHDAFTTKARLTRAVDDWVDEEDDEFADDNNDQGNAAEADGAYADGDKDRAGDTCADDNLPPTMAQVQQIEDRVRALRKLLEQRQAQLEIAQVESDVADGLQSRNAAAEKKLSIINDKAELVNLNKMLDKVPTIRQAFANK